MNNHYCLLLLYIVENEAISVLFEKRLMAMRCALNNIAITLCKRFSLEVEVFLLSLLLFFVAINEEVVRANLDEGTVTYKLKYSENNNESIGYQDCS